MAAIARVLDRPIAPNKSPYSTKRLAENTKARYLRVSLR